MRKLEISPKVQWFSEELERAMRDDKETSGLNEKNLSHAFFLDRLFDKMATLVLICNECKSRSEVIRQAALVANVCRQIAALEKTDDKNDFRELDKG